MGLQTYAHNLDKVTRVHMFDAGHGSWNWNCAASEAKETFYGRRKKKISREEMEQAMREFLNQGGKITKLPPYGYDNKEVEKR